jgi:hypothetical protein
MPCLTPFLANYASNLVAFEFGPIVGPTRRLFPPGRPRNMLTKFRLQNGDSNIAKIDGGEVCSLLSNFSQRATAKRKTFFVCCVFCSFRGCIPPRLKTTSIPHSHFFNRFQSRFSSRVVLLLVVVAWSRFTDLFAATLFCLLQTFEFWISRLPSILDVDARFMDLFKLFMMRYRRLYLFSSEMVGRARVFVNNTVVAEHLEEQNRFARFGITAYSGSYLPQHTPLSPRQFCSRSLGALQILSPRNSFKLPV